MLTNPVKYWLPEPAGSGIIDTIFKNISPGGVFQHGIDN
jgi:hypothetical protein